MTRADSNRITTGSLDFYPTPAWATRAFFKYCSVDVVGTIWEPACGAGHMVRALEEQGLVVTATDIQIDGLDFTTRLGVPCDWVITNPPFNKAAEFVLAALQHAEMGVAMFVRYSFLEGQGRYAALFKHHAPSAIYQFVERVALVEGKTDSKAGSAVPYIWAIWDKRKREAQTTFGWIPPCKAALTQKEDWY